MRALLFLLLFLPSLAFADFQLQAFLVDAVPKDRGYCDIEGHRFPCALTEYQGKEYIVVFVMLNGSLAPGFIVDKAEKEVVWVSPIIEDKVQGRI